MYEYDRAYLLWSCLLGFWIVPVVVVKYLDKFRLALHYPKHL